MSHAGCGCSLPVTPITASSAFGLRADALHPGEVTSGALQNLTQLRLLGVTEPNSMCQLTSQTTQPTLHPIPFITPYVMSLLYCQVSLILDKITANKFPNSWLCCDIWKMGFNEMMKCQSHDKNCSLGKGSKKIKLWKIPY